MAIISKKIGSIENLLGVLQSQDSCFTKSKYTGLTLFNKYYSFPPFKTSQLFNSNKNIKILIIRGRDSYFISLTL